MIVLDATYINNSGGKVLLEFLIRSVYSDERIIYLLDPRLSSVFIDELIPYNRIVITKSEIDRYRFYKENFDKIKKVFCFANVPPPTPLTVEVFIYFHNVLLIDIKDKPLFSVSFISRFLKRVYIRTLNRSHYKWLVQTETTKCKLTSALRIEENNTLVLPFFEVEQFVNVNENKEGNNLRYLYVANGEAQKNHENLFSAWKLALYDCNIRDFYELHVTIPPGYIALINQVNDLIKEGYRIINHELCSRNEIIRLYSICNFTIFPSLNESFGLPLIEAATANCKVIASNLAFVHEVIVPSLVFDPLNIDDIASTIIRSFDSNKLPKTKIKTNNKMDIIIQLIFNHV